MAGTMNSRSISLPKSFPPGSIYVVEGTGGERGRLRVSSRYVMLPNGRKIDFPPAAGRPDTSSNHARRRAHALRPVRKSVAGRLPPAKKIAAEVGTSR
jgi:hypothetical protein